MNYGHGHGIQADIDYVGAFLFETAEREREHTPREHTRERPPHVAPRRMVPTDNPDDYPPAPPPISGYRPADIQGIACWNCGHFSCCGDSDGDGVIDGICNLWETQAEGEYTCDRFTAHPDLFRQQPHTSWREDEVDDARDSYDRRFDRGPGVMSAEYSDTSSMNEVNFADAAVSESDGLVWKNILRTGVWNSMPTTKGVIKKKLQIVKDGVTDIAKGVISLSELKQNFDDKAVPYVTIPLSDDERDHKNIARLNTGFVRQLEVTDPDEEGISYLRAGMDFTDPEVKQRVLRQEIPDVSAGIPFGVTRRSDDKFFSSVLDHVCLTRKPFVDRLGPFGIAAADGEEIPTEAWEQGESVSPGPTDTPPENSPSFRQLEGEIRAALSGILLDPSQYEIEDVAGNFFVIRHRISRVAWRPTYTRQGDLIIPQAVNSWEIIDEGPTEEAVPEATPVAASDLQRAHELRELQLSQQTSDSGGIDLSTLNLDGVELSDEQRTAIQSILGENQRLARENREAAVDKRIDELQKIPGLKDRPGALKFYREVMLSDDGRPAAILFSDGPESDQVPITAVEILDRFIDAVKGESGVSFSDQALASGNDIKPPLDASGERKPLEERLEASRQALYGKNGQRRTGRR
jgi:hypothetical protein